MSNRSGQVAFLYEVVQWFQARGFAGVRPASYLRASSKPYSAQEAGDMFGLDGWTLKVKNQVTIDLSGSLNLARTEAARSGTDKYAVIQSRRDYLTGESYVTMPLSVFASMVRDSQNAISWPQKTAPEVSGSVPRGSGSAPSPR